MFGTPEGRFHRKQLFHHSGWGDVALATCRACIKAACNGESSGVPGLPELGQTRTEEVLLPQGSAPRPLCPGGLQTPPLTCFKGQLTQLPGSAVTWQSNSQTFVLPEQFHNRDVPPRALGSEVVHPSTQTAAAPLKLLRKQILKQGSSYTLYLPIYLGKLSLKKSEFWVRTLFRILDFLSLRRAWRESNGWLQEKPDKGYRRPPSQKLPTGQSDRGKQGPRRRS